MTCPKCGGPVLESERFEVCEDDLCGWGYYYADHGWKPGGN